MTPKSIFISYRRRDVPDTARSIHELLSDRFGRKVIFKDDETIPPGADYQDMIDEWLDNCAVLIAVIGQNWLTATDDKGRIRLTNRKDPVRSEIEEAINRNILIIPVVVPPAQQLTADDLIHTLQPLAQRQSIHLSTTQETYARDAERLVQTVGNWLEQFDPIAAADEDEADPKDTGDTNVPKAYIEHLKKVSAHIEILGLDSQKVLPDGLPRIYVPAITQAARKDDVREPQLIKWGFDLVLHRLGADSLYLAGAPGSGKTTFCQWVTYLATHGAMPTTSRITLPGEPVDAVHEDLVERLPDALAQRLPLWIRLRDFWEALALTDSGTSWTAKQLEQAICDWLDSPKSPGLPSASFLDHLKDGRLLILVDGVDEVPEEDQRDGKTCYPRTNLLTGLAEALVKWHKSGNRVLVTSRPYGLKANQRARLDLPEAELAPLTDELQSLFVTRWYQATDPDRWRTFADGLFKEIADRDELENLKQNPLLLTALCVKFRDGKRLPQDAYHLYDAVINSVLYNRFSGSDKERRRVRWRLGAVALGMHYRIADDAPRSAPLASVHRNELDRIVEEYIQRNRSTEGGSADIQERVDELLERSGLLLPRNETTAEFFHQDFRDFLAAEHWSRSKFTFESALRDYAEHRDWRRMLSFLFAEQIERGGLESALADLRNVAERLSDAAFSPEAALVLADCLEIGAGTAAEADFGDGWSKRFMDICMSSLTHAPKAVDRNELFLALGRLGWDTRPGVGLTGNNVPDIVWLPVPDAANPQFFIAKYLTTSLQFQAFVDSGYDDPRWWTDIEAHREPYSNELWWEANAPCIRVSWYQAVAYARWLESKVKPPLDNATVSLPTEAEWVSAYVGDAQREFPWQKTLDAQRHANFGDTGLGRTNCVGIFPGGVAASGALDMAGNLLEWCSSKYDDPDGQDADDSSDRRVLRGGSWDFSSDYLRSSFRGRGHPGLRGDYVGFRVVCRPRLISDR